MRRFILKLLLIVVPVGLLVTGTNYLIDPANIISGESYVEGIANIMSKGHNVENLSNYDERLLQEQMIKRLRKAPDIIVLGSSRVMEINSSFFPGKSLLNCGVSHGNIQDITAIIGIIDSLHKMPDEIILGVDQWLIGKEGTSEWQSLYPYHNYMVTKLLGTNLGKDEYQSLKLKKLSTLFGLSYFKSSLQFLLKNKSKHYSDVGLDKPRTYGRFSDGSICYSKDYTNPDVQKVAIEARGFGSKGLPVPDTFRIRQLVTLLDFLQEKKIKVHLTMVPLHPEFYKAVRYYHKQVVEEWGQIFNTIAMKHNIILSGSFDADSIGMPENAFYDSYHCSGESIKKYIPIL